MPEPVEDLIESLQADLRRFSAALHKTVEDLEHAEALLQVEFNAGGQSGLRAEAIASIRKARLRIAAMLA